MSQGPETVLSGPLGPLLAVRAPPDFPPFSNDRKEPAPLTHPPGERAAQHLSSDLDHQPPTDRRRWMSNPTEREEGILPKAVTPP